MLGYAPLQRQMLQRGENTQRTAGPTYVLTYRPFAKSA